MRMKEANFETALRRALEQKPGLSQASEAALFARAEELLSSRRELISARNADARRMSQARASALLASRQLISRMIELLAIHPNGPAAAATLVACVLAFVALESPLWPSGWTRLSYSDLPDFPRFNDVPSRYDAQRLAERQAYERERENADKETSGGI